MLLSLRGRRYAAVALFVTTVVLVVLASDASRATAKQYIAKAMGKVETNSTPPQQPEEPQESQIHPRPVYLPEPEWVPPPVEDPFPGLATSGPPPIPPWNAPREDLHRTYGLDYAPPLLIGFTRAWPLLLQAVVSYITAGWPPAQIHVLENTGVQWANARGRLSLQNPFYLDHAALARLGVRVVRAPVLMSFAQLQNFYTHLAHENGWPYYFWSHMDVLALSFEDGLEGVTPPAGQAGYRSLYELCLAELNRTAGSGERWADRFFAYDHLTLVNRRAYDAVGGWDTFIPYYMNDCDMHSRLLMDNWTQADARAGIITDVNASLKNLRALYRDRSVEVGFRDPNPPPPEPSKAKRSSPSSNRESSPDQSRVPGNQSSADHPPRNDSPSTSSPSDDDLAYWRQLRDVSDAMFHYKHGARGRNTWQTGQRGGVGEPFYYPARGIAEAVEVLTEAGREVFRRKWGHRGCDLAEGAGLRLGDQWRVAKDWE